MSDSNSSDIIRLDDQGLNSITGNSANLTEYGAAVVIDHTKNDSEEILTLNVPVVSVGNAIEDTEVFMEEDVGQDTSPDKNITVAELGGPSSSSEAKIRQHLEPLLLESMQFNV